MNRKLLKLIVFITVTLVCTEVLASTFGASYIAKWKGNAQAAYSITFDDNGVSHKDIMKASILEEYGLRGTFFPITSYMNVEMFSEIFHRGHELGSHSVTHPKLNGASIDLIWSELSESKLFIEELTGVPCVSYSAPYGQLDSVIVGVAQEMYISARGIRPGINAIADENLFNLRRGPYPPYSYDPNTSWTDDEYCQRLKTYVEEVIEAGGWGIDTFHNLALSPQELNSGAQVNESVLRNHLSDMTSSYASSLWIAPQGEVARYHLEWKETTINSWSIDDNIILVDLVFDGDKEIFDEPLTVVTAMPKHWIDGNLMVMQNGRRLEYVVDVDGDEQCLLYDAIPGSSTISIVFESNHSGLDYGVSYLAKWKNNADAALSVSFNGNGIGANRSSAAAILEEYDIRGTFNPITSYMDEEIFLDIFNRGHELGSCSVSYRRLIGASMETIVYELAESKQAIENLTASPCVSYTAPYGHTEHDIEIVAREIYLSVVGVKEGINTIADANVFDLQIGPVPPYYDNPETNWSNEKYCTKMIEYLDQVIEAEGWGIQVFNDWTSSGEFNNGLIITETALRTYLSEINKNLSSTVWIAPQGVVARYYLERQGTTIEILMVTGDSILLNLLFDGDKAIFNEPLTVMTVIPEYWLSGEITVTQQGSLLDYYVEQHETEVRLVYDAMPGGGSVAIMFEPIYNQK